MAEKEVNPREDLISALVAARRESRVSTEELRNLLVTLVFGAHDSTRRQLANATVVFAEHPDQWTLLSRRPEFPLTWRPAIGTHGPNTLPLRFSPVDREG